MKKLLILILALNLNTAHGNEKSKALEEKATQLRELYKEQQAIVSSETCRQVGANTIPECTDASAKSKEIQKLLKETEDEILGIAPTPTAEGAITGDAASKLEQKINLAIKKSDDAFSGGNSEFSTLPGTTTFKVCQKVLSAVPYNSLKEIYSGKNPSSLTNEQISSIADAFAGKVMRSVDNSLKDPAEVKKFIESNPQDKVIDLVSKSYQQAITQTRNCLMMYASVGDNFEGSDANYKQDKYKKPEDQKSWDGRISCKLSGPETIDFDGCMNVLNAYNGAKVVFEGTNAVQQVQAQDFMYEQQMKLMQQDTTDIDSSTAALESQKDGLKKQENMAETRRALLIAKIGVLEGLVSKLPNSEETIEKCKKANFGGVQIDDILKRMPNDLNQNFSLRIIPDGSENNCNDSFFSVTGSHDILANQGLATSVHAIALEAGVDVVKESVAINAFGKQQNMLDGIINKVKGAEVVDLPEGFTTQEELAQYCMLYPAAAECAGLGNGTSTMIGAGNGISMNGNFGTNTNDLNIDDSSALDSATDDDGNLTKANIPTSTVYGGVDKGGGFADSIAPKAKVENAGFANPAGSGGAGASAPGLSGGGSQQGAAPAGGNSPSGSKLSYLGGGRSLSFSGGRGNSKSATKADGNPFANMFGNKAATGDVINFRDLASKGEIGRKNGNIFDQISKQYNKVEKEDKLLKYDFVDKQ